MKRYISAILVPSFLLQIFGCYSTRELTLDELQNSDNANIITKDSTIYHLSNKLNDNYLKNKPNEYYSDYWIVNRDSSKIDLVINKVSTEQVNNSVRHNITKENTSIMFSEISNISVEEFNIGKTCLWSGLGLIGFAGLYVAGWFIANPEW